MYEHFRIIGPKWPILNFRESEPAGKYGLAT
jgi:hypothetical protein